MQLRRVLALESLELVGEEAMGDHLFVLCTTCYARALQLQRAHQPAFQVR